MNFSYRRNSNISAQKIPKKFVLLVLTLFIIGIIPLYHTSKWYRVENMEIKIKKDDENCDIFTGEWVPNPEGPYYTNTTCRTMHEHQNCMKYERPDTDFSKWRWKPKGCELPIFNPYEFLDMMRNKSLAFIGDSLGTNQMESLMCLLSRVEHPVELPTSGNEDARWKFITYNYTLTIYISKFLVKMNQAPDNTELFDLYLDEADEKWANEIQEFDYVIINGGQWFFKCGVYYKTTQLAGCRYHGFQNVTHSYQKALRTVFKTINNLENYKGTTFLRTISPSHFEGGDWNKGGDCVRKRPFSSNETTLNVGFLEMHNIQVDEFKRAEEEGKKKGNEFRLMDITQAMHLRPDGHPSRYGHSPNKNLVYKKIVMYNDCVHWCLPGPIDAWSDFLLHMLKLEGN